jgi:hypothetical protein
VEKFGGGEWSYAAAAYILEAKHHLPPGHFGYKNPLKIGYKPRYEDDELKINSTRSAEAARLKKN